MELEIRVDPVTGLKCRSDGAVYHPGDARHPAKWTYGCKQSTTRPYCVVCFQYQLHLVHRLVCRAFHGESPEDKPFVDHKNRIESDNRPENLRWVTAKENNANRGVVLNLLAQGRVRSVGDHALYLKELYAANTEFRKRQLSRCHTYYAKGRLDPTFREIRRERAKAYREKMKALGFVECKGHIPHWVKKETLIDNIGDNT